MLFFSQTEGQLESHQKQNDEMEHELERFVEDVAHIKNELENEVKDKERYGKPAGFLQSFFVYMVCKGPGNLYFSHWLLEMKRPGKNVWEASLNCLYAGDSCMRKLLHSWRPLTH